MRSPDKAFSVWAARGGHGSTTIAGAIALTMNLPLRSHDPDATEWLWPSFPQPRDIDELHVFDAGTNRTACFSTNVRAETIVVLRGPCSLAAVTLAQWADQIDHLIILRELGRPLQRHDIEAALGIAVAAEVAVTSRVARLADAGLLTQRVTDLDEFSEMKDWALRR